MTARRGDGEFELHFEKEELFVFLHLGVICSISTSNVECVFVLNLCAVETERRVDGRH